MKLTALHHRVIRLACWLCIKQEQTELAALLRPPAGTRTAIWGLGAHRCTVVLCAGRHTVMCVCVGALCYITSRDQFQTLSDLCHHRNIKKGNSGVWLRLGKDDVTFENVRYKLNMLRQLTLNK